MEKPMEKAMEKPRLYREGSWNVQGMAGPLLFAGSLKGIGYGELVTVETRIPGGQTSARTGQVLQVQDDLCVIQLFDDTPGLETGNTTVWMERDIAKVPVGEHLRGRILNGCGQTMEGKSLYGAEEFLPVNGPPINPALRVVPSEPIETGISSLDLTNTLMQGQRLALFGGPGLPLEELAALIASRARASGGDSLLVVFAAMGVTDREAGVFMESFARGEILEDGVFLLNKADAPVMERLLTPRVALTIAEYFAFVKGRDVLVVMTDMLRYCEALREVGAARKEFLGRKGYPVYLRSDLAGIYERAGCVAGRRGRVTEIVVVGTPGDDIAHPVADATGYIVDGRIVLDRRLHAAGIFPPVDLPAGFSRLMNRGIGHGRTFDSHSVLAAQLHSAYAKAREGDRLRLRVGNEGLSDLEKSYIKFGEFFEKIFIDQRGGTGAVERRTFAQSEAKAWEALRRLPAEELYCLPGPLSERKLKQS